MMLLGEVMMQFKTNFNKRYFDVCSAELESRLMSTTNLYP